jgi:hypothetical protein
MVARGPSPACWSRAVPRRASPRICVAPAAAGRTTRTCDQLQPEDVVELGGPVGGAIDLERLRGEARQGDGAGGRVGQVRVGEREALRAQRVRGDEQRDRDPD